ncbi:molybdate ABC transporter substrate-binding protein [Thiohalospira sp.]|uniref:molybdate ABC transporter substrate-binding protein n=1 Tax=Thiohalospira sp. TaxID=3080549 RepID=UPI003980944B
MRGMVTGVLLALASLPAAAETVRVAVASNFAEPLEAVAEAFEQETGHTVRASTGSTGKHYAQIDHGSPFDLFLAADARRPRLLEEGGQAVAGSRFTYAVGRLALYSPDPAAFEEGRQALEEGAFDRLAIANPELAPYGRAARRTLKALGVWSTLEPRLVRGENIGQTHQYVVSGNADAGLVALSQVVAAEGSRWVVPTELHDPVRQQAVLLERGADNPAARTLLEFLRGPEAAAILEEYGYGTAQGS